ncbi:hypothetical protein JXA88_04370 [Candidatus Fermentibacteria bacterium]|nr:hypothetical protein [Candidatus Fermentibacteria bacterium]
MFFTIPHTYETVDFKELFSASGSARWEEVWRNTDVLAIYGNSVLPWWRKRRHPERYASGHFQDDDELFAMGAWLQTRGISLCIAAGGIKEWSLDAVSARTRTEDMVNRLVRNGCHPASIRIDESLYAGLKHGQTLDGVVETVARNYCLPLGNAFNDLKIGVVEPWPACTAARIESYVVQLARRGTPPAFVHIDINYPRVGVIGSVPELVEALETISRLGIPIGIIAWSSNFHTRPTTSAEYCWNTLDFAGWMHGYFDRFCDHHIVQSWQPYPTHCLPEDGDDTFMWLVREYGRLHVRDWQQMPTGPIV